ncbi:MAG: hypothetical protein GF308_06795 [Candidatus Heimdallarchaeota archaeon]|nr:hypothetical protein [Candidatus Heimdallarchaeota archaeon]
MTMGKIKDLMRKSWLLKTFLRARWPVKQQLIKGFLQRKKYYPKESVNADIKNLINCMLCPNMCRFDCPAVQASKKETHAPATKARIGYYLEMNRLEKIPENILPLFEGCVHCSGCQVHCPFDFAVGDLLEGVAVDLFSKQQLPQSIMTFSERISKNNGLYPTEKYQQAYNALSPLSEGDIYYFPGCVTMGNNTKVISGIAKIANKVNRSLISKPQERWCCGAPLMYAGDLEKAKELAEHNKAHFQSLDIKTIICECPECTYMLREKYKQLGYDLKIPVLHVSEWLASLLAEGALEIQNGEKETFFVNNLPIGFHDPCVLARKLGVLDPPRELLMAMFPNSLREVPYSREITHCCGFGGLVNIANSEIANQMAQNRLAEFKKAEIKTIVTSCPTCYYSFMKNNTELQFEIFDLVEAVAALIQ